MSRRDTIEELRAQVAECERAREQESARRQRCEEAEWKRLEANGPSANAPEARACVLAIVLMLENRLDALAVTEYAHVKQGNVEQARIGRLRGLLGVVTDEETAAATALWDETAT